MSTYRFLNVGPRPIPLSTVIHSAANGSGKASSLRADLDHAINDVLGVGDRTRPAQNIAVDGREDACSFTIEYDIPGVDPDSIDVRAEDGVLTVQGQRPTRVPVDGERDLFMERTTGAFVRRLKFPKSADMSSIAAHYALGVLSIRVAKIAPPKPNRVQIKVESVTEINRQKTANKEIVENSPTSEPPIVHR